MNAPEDKPELLPDEPDINKTIELGAGSKDAFGSRGTDHGEQGWGDTAHCRWCAGHGWHGLYYECSLYSGTIIARIGRDRVEWKRHDEAWVQKMRERGAPPRMIAWFIVFADRSDPTGEQRRGQ